MTNKELVGEVLKSNLGPEPKAEIIDLIYRMPEPTADPLKPKVRKKRVKAPVEGVGGL